MAQAQVSPRYVLKTKSAQVHDPKRILDPAIDRPATGFKRICGTTAVPDVASLLRVPGVKASKRSWWIHRTILTCRNSNEIVALSQPIDALPGGG